MKRAIIIGATSGIGQEVAKILLLEGWKLGVAGRRRSALEIFQKIHADAASASAEFPVQSTRHHRFSAGGGGDRRKRPGGGGAGRPPVCGRAGKNAGGTKQVGNCPATAGQFLRNHKGVHSTFSIYC